LNVPGDAQARFDTRCTEVAPGDILVLLTDGLTEGRKLSGERYGCRFQTVVEQQASTGARTIAEAILDDWRSYARESDDGDDVTVLVATIGG